MLLIKNGSSQEIYRFLIYSFSSRNIFLIFEKQIKYDLHVTENLFLVVFIIIVVVFITFYYKHTNHYILL